MPRAIQSPVPIAGRAARIVLAFAAIYLVWGTTYLAIRVAVAEIPPLLMVGLRCVTAGGILYAFGRLRGVPAPTASEWRSALLVGALFFAVGQGGLAWAEQRVPSGLAALVMATFPLWVVFLEAVTRTGPPAGPRVVLGLGLGVGGVAALIRGAPGGVAGLDPTATAVMVLGALAWAVGSMPRLGRGLPRSTTMSAAAELLAGGVMVLAAALVRGEARGFVPSAASAGAWLAVAYLIVFGSLVAFTAYHWLLGVVPVSFVATDAFVNPLVAVVVGWAFAGEVLAPRDLAAAVAIVAAAALIVTNPRRRAPAIVVEGHARPPDAAVAPATTAADEPSRPTHGERRDP